MLRCRRSAYLLFHCHDEIVLDVDAMLRGAVRTEAWPRLTALSILCGEQVALDSGDLEIALRFPADEWTEVRPDDASDVERLARKGVLVLDGSGDAELEELRRRDDSLVANQWNVYAALYHFLTRWRDVDIGADAAPGQGMVEGVPEISETMIERFIERYGPPPGPFHELQSPRSSLQLPLADRDGSVFRTLLSRRTTRAFDPDAELDMDEFATVLRYVFGCHGWAPTGGDLYAIRRTSPSGGSMHPVEAYPLVSRVRGVEPGLYHYCTRDHTLELVAPLAADEASLLATEFVSGQSYLGAAQASVILTARWYRSFWKYRRHQKAYASLLMDAGHLSQTLYIVAAELGLGAYVTVAINSTTIDDKLGVDPVSEGAIAVVGFGRRRSGGGPLEPRFRPYRPRETPPPG